MTTPPPNNSSSTIFSAPTFEQLELVKYESETNSVATRQELEQIALLWGAMGISNDRVAHTAWDLARHCADTQAAKSSDLVGLSPGTAVPRSMLAAAVKQKTTLRRFCSYFAKVVWNQMLITNTPPASWAAMGYQDDTKFAAFDFFDAVLSPASLNPIGGLVREPTEKEIQAHQVNKYVAITRANQTRGNLLSTMAEVTRGKHGYLPTITMEPPP